MQKTDAKRKMQKVHCKINLRDRALNSQSSKSFPLRINNLYHCVVVLTLLFLLGKCHQPPKESMDGISFLDNRTLRELMSRIRTSIRN